MAVVEKIELENAKIDCADLAKAVNDGPSPGTVTTRLGRVLKTVARLIADFEAKLPNWRGTWSNATAYIAGDVVTHGGSSYYAIVPNQNQTPGVPGSVGVWDLIAQTGDISQARTQNNVWSGSNTFQGPTIVPTPTAGSQQAASAAYVESYSAGKTHAAVNTILSTTAGFYSGAGNRATRARDGRVLLQFGFYMAAVVANNWTTVGTLAVGWRPTWLPDNAFIRGIAIEATALAEPYCHPVRIYKDGSIAAYGIQANQSYEVLLDYYVD